ncbi:MAG: RAMP superfamily CRISPR-associated protein, partial [Desulfurococcales archaeon]|nr:RAMP superfamily CRISPR-associated protein [Desulfurococcales archaeon]
MALARLLLASALTPLHPGAGRAPGVVDLPVVRDTLGYPYIRGTMIKGALKTHLARKLNCSHVTTGKGPNRINYDHDKCSQLYCLLGGEVGEGDKGASAVSIQDLYPLFIPAPAYILPQKMQEEKGDRGKESSSCSRIDSSLSG